MTARTYGQFCGLARALELVGERWALLIVRDLVLGPKRFTDLRAGLPRIPTNVLSTRLKELERTGILLRRVLPRPAGSVVYELTEYGHDLEDALLRLGRWGARSLGERQSEDTLNADSLVLTLRSAFRPAAARGLTASYELHVGDVVAYASVKEGVLDSAEGTIDAPGLVIHAGTALRALLSGELDAARAEETLRLRGDTTLLPGFTAAFRFPPAP